MSSEYMQVVPVSQKLIPHIWRFPLYSFDRHQIAQFVARRTPTCLQTLAKLKTQSQT